MEMRSAWSQLLLLQLLLHLIVIQLLSPRHTTLDDLSRLHDRPRPHLHLRQWRQQ